MFRNIRLRKLTLTANTLLHFNIPRFRNVCALLFFTIVTGALATGCATTSKAPQAIWEEDAKPVEILTTGAGEGPAWHPEFGLLFSGDGNIQQWQTNAGLSVFRKGAGTNGLLFDHQGRLLACEPKQRQVTRLEQDGSLTVLTSHFQGGLYNAPNDITVDEEGRIYFSDPKYGDRSGMEILDKNGSPIEGVYLIRQNGRVERVIMHEVDRPNGVLVSLDQKHLYVADNNNNTVGGAHKLWRFRRKSDGSLNLQSKKLIFDWKTSRGPDGMVQDSLGRIYVAGGLNKDNLPHETKLPYPGGIFVFSSNGKLLDHLPIPNDEVTNCAFGGPDLKTLYITAGGHLWNMRASSSGALPWPSLQMTQSHK